MYRNADEEMGWRMKCLGVVPEDYHTFGFPHASLHSAGEVIRWFDKTGLEFKGAFAPLRIRDYRYAFAQPEYRVFRNTFAGFPVMRVVTDVMAGLASATGSDADPIRHFPRPGPLSRWMSQMIWIVFGLRFNCFTMTATKRS